MAKSWKFFNHHRFVNISPTLVIIDTSMERSSRILQHGNQKCEFHKIKVAKAQKNSSLTRHFPRLYIGGSVAVHFRCSLSFMEATSLHAPADPVVPGKKVSAVMFCKLFLPYAVHILIGAIMQSINIQLGLNMHLHDDIGDASSSLRGSTSSFERNYSIKTSAI